MISIGLSDVTLIRTQDFIFRFQHVHSIICSYNLLAPIMRLVRDHVSRHFWTNVLQIMEWQNIRRKDRRDSYIQCIRIVTKKQVYHFSNGGLNVLNIYSYYFIPEPRIRYQTKSWTHFHYLNQFRCTRFY